MKKLIFILGFLIIAFTANAQIRVVREAFKSEQYIEATDSIISSFARFADSLMTNWISVLDSLEVNDGANITRIVPTGIRFPSGDLQTDIPQTITIGSDNQIPFVDGTGNDLEYDASFTFDGTTFYNGRGTTGATALFDAYQTSTGIGIKASGSSTQTGTLVEFTSPLGLPLKLISGSTTGTVSSNMFELSRQSGGSNDFTGNIIDITDNPTTSGSISGKLFTATIGAVERVKLDPRVADGASAVAYFFDTENTLVDNGAKLASFRNNQAELAYIHAGGSFYNNALIQAGWGTSNTRMADDDFTMTVSSTVRLDFQPDVTDGASAVAYEFDTHNDLSTAGAKLLSIQNQNSEKAFIDYFGSLTLSGYIDVPEISTPANPAADVGRLYVADDAGTTTLYFRDNAGTERSLLEAGGDKVVTDTLEAATMDAKIVFNDQENPFIDFYSESNLNLQIQGASVLVNTSLSAEALSVDQVYANGQLIRGGVKSGDGYDLTVKGGPAGTGDYDGGDLILEGGDLTGSGTQGDVVVSTNSDLLVNSTPIDEQLGGQDVNSNMTSPTSGEDGYLVSWDNTGTEYELTEVVDASEAAGIMLVARGQVLYSSETQTTIITLPTDAVVWDIQVEVRTLFDDSGTDLLGIGVTATADRYEADLDISGTGWPTMSLANIPDRMSGSTNITFQYDGQNNNATQGEAYVYVHYSTH